MSSNLRGEFFLHKRDSKLHASEPVHAAVQRARERGERVEQKPASHIRAYLERFRVLFQPVDGNNQIREFTQARNLEMFDSLLLSRIGIQKENIPDSYWELQRRLAREQGHGDVELSPSTKNELSDILIKDQKDSLHRWTSYFASPDSNAIPLWAKYWAFSAVVKLGKYDADTHRFQHRSIDTVAPFPELNREALAKASEVVERAIQDTIPEDWDTELRRLAKQASFSSLYGHFLHELSAAPEQNLQIIDGSWRIFPKNSDPSALVDSLRGYSTGWCTAGYHTAETQLRAGDFHVYYSKNTSGEAVVPRVAIRMEGDSIGEIRGIGPDQNLDPYISPIMEQKMKEFGTEGDKYQKKSHHMKMLTEIEHLHKEGKPLSVEQLRFLWELDEQVQGFGYEEDPRVRELQSERNFRSDLAVCYGTTAEHVSISMQSKGFDKDEHIFSEGIVVHYGDLSIRPYDRSQWPAHIPQIVLGDFETSLEDLSGLSLPKEVHGNLDIRSVQELKQEFLPDKYNGIINFQVKNLENLTFLSSATGIFRFDAVERISDVIFPPHVESLMLGSYLFGWSQDTSLDLQRVQFPEIVEESFSIDGVKDLSNVRLPRKVGSIALTGLERFESVNWPLEIDKSISLPDLKSANGLRLPESFTGSVEFSSLESVEGLKLPKMLHDVTFTSLKTGEGLKLPYKMTGELKMNYLHSARGIVFPREVVTISLHQLESLDGLSLDRPLSEEDRARKNNGEFVSEPSIRVEVGYRISNDEIKQFYDRPENRTANHSIIQRD